MVRVFRLRGFQDLGRVIGLPGMKAGLESVFVELAKAVLCPIDIEGIGAIRVVEQIRDIGADFIAVLDFVGADNVAILCDEIGAFPPVGVLASSDRLSRFRG